MKIKNISCTQFAGVRDRNVSFTDGINVIYGKNESGKSTLVNLISRTLFQDVKLNKSTKEGKDFPKLYYPSARKGGGFISTSADGKIVFETEKGTYTLSKVWGDGESCVLSTPDGVFRSSSQIEEILKDALLYGEGVYSDMLLSSQRNTDVSLQTILDASKKTDAKQEIANAVSQAFAESDGISVDAIEQAIAEKITEIQGDHWDLERDIPKKKTGGGRWSVAKNDPNKDQLLKAYYALEDARETLKEISSLERKADDAANTYVELDAAARTAEDAYNRFNTFASRLAVQSERKKAIDYINRELSKIAEDLADWPKLSIDLEKAKALQTEKVNRDLLDKHESAKKIANEIEEFDAIIANLACPTNDEIGQVKTAQSDITSLENKLCGMNITAAINMLGGNNVKITSVRTGDIVDLSGGIASITETVKITVPGVMEMQLSPADVDVSAVEEQLAGQEEIVGNILGKYKVETLADLEQLARTINDTKSNREAANSCLVSILGSTSFEELEAATKTITTAVRAKDEIDGDILALCQGVDVATFITTAETVIRGYDREYGSVNELETRAFKLEEELKDAKDSLSGAKNIPDEYLDITDDDAYLKSLHKELQDKRKLRDGALRKKIDTAKDIEHYMNSITGEPKEEKERAERIFEEQKTLLNHWCHIQKIFIEQKESLNNNPMQDIAERFAHYLSIISGDRVFSEFPQADKLNVNIYSDNRLLDYGKLSEGTKETVSLAFRLAVLDHLFPEGGGVIVFDDPFTDMDAERTAQSCELIKECATRHQVIFLTCKEDYLSALEGNRILF